MLSQVRVSQRQMEGTAPSDDLAALSSHAEVLAYVVHCARANGRSEEEAADQAELVVILADLDRDLLREAAHVLKPLGYTVLADRLRELAKRARKPRPSAVPFKLRLAPRHLLH